MKRGTILLLLSGISLFGFSQRQTDQSVWQIIRSSLNNKSMLSSSFQRVQSIKKNALGYKNYNDFTRASYYEMLITDLRTEDTFYFKNSAFIDSILFDPATGSELKMWMHILQAKRLDFFRSKYLSFNRALYEMKNQPYNYAAFSKFELDSLVDYHLIESYQIVQNLRTANLGEYDWIASDTSIFLFKPTLQDIIYAERILKTPALPFLPQVLNRLNRWISLPQIGFIDSLKAISNNKEKEYRTFKLYHEWIISQPNQNNLYFIETLARKYCYSFISGNDSAQRKYENYLQRLTISPFNSVKAHGVYQLCLLWIAQGEKYKPRDEYVTPKYDSIYQYHPTKALTLYEENIEAMQMFHSLNSILALMKKQILAKELNFKMQEYHIPGRPILSQLNYRNIGHIYYRIVRAWHNEYIGISNKSRSAYLSGKAPVINMDMAIPLPNDHNNHTAFLKLDPLPAGQYFILLSDEPIVGGDSSLNCLSITVTDIAILNADKRVFLLNRNTGIPLGSATVYAGFKNPAGNKGSLLQNSIPEKKYEVNREGFVILDEAQYYMRIYSHGDTAIFDVNSQDRMTVPSSIYSDNHYDDLLEFYEDNIKMSVFTDRSIYRPGQTVYYKMIFTANDPTTGKLIIVNKENLKEGLFKDFLKRWINENEPRVFIVNPFNVNVDTIDIRPNEFGSVSGHFKIPSTSATGEWSFESDEIETDYRNKGYFSVEEYKRPTFELTVENEKKELKPGDPFKFTVKVKSFSGAKLNNVLVNYSITRNGSIPGDPEDNEELTIADTSGHTDNNGTLEIQVADAALGSYKFTDERKWLFTYELEAEVIDETGESYETDKRMTISSQPIDIRVPLTGTYSRTKLPSPLVRTSDINAGEVVKKVKLSIYRAAPDLKIYTDIQTDKADQWIYPVKQFEEWFPFSSFTKAQPLPERQLVFEKEVNAIEFERIQLPVEKLVAGEYIFEAICEEKGRITGKRTGEFSIYDPGEKKLPATTFMFNHLEANTLSKGDTIKLVNGNSVSSFFSIYRIKWYSKTHKRTIIKDSYKMQLQPGELNEWHFKVPDDAVEQMNISQIYILNNEVHKRDHTIYLTTASDSRTEITLEQYRKVLTPGGQATFTVSIKSKNEKVAAELMSTLYDASLDKLEKHTWEIPTAARLDGLDDDWVYTLNRNISISPHVNAPIEGLNSSNILQLLRGRAAGVVIETTGLESVVVVGYSSVRAKKTVGSYTMTIRGLSTITDFRQPLIIVDGIPYTGDLNKLDPATITQAIVLKDMEATSIYGARGAGGVLVISTKGEIILPLPKMEEPQVRVRKDFNETAFFFPAINAERDGNYKLSFTMPESVTEWNWKLLAHTKKADFSYEERKIITQLPLMVQPNMPRLLYQGDRMILRSRIVNLDTSAIKGTVFCKIEDAVTGEDITSTILPKPRNDFSINAKSNIAAVFELNIPATHLNPLKIVVVANAPGFADAEEHIIPVLSKEILVKRNERFRFINTDTLLKAPVLGNADKVYGVGLSIMPTPQTSLVNSLVYLSNYSFNCAEQVFNKLLAHVTAVRVMRSDEQLRNSFNRIQQSAQQETVLSALPGEIGDQTMPWLSLTNKTVQEQRKQLLLFDTLRSNSIIGEYLNKLFELQNADGGLAWFNGGPSNRYISAYVLAGFGKLNADGWTPAITFLARYRDFINKLVNYFDHQLSVTEHYSLYESYARSFWIMNYPLGNTSVSRIHANIKDSWNKVNRMSLAKQALLINTSFRYFTGVNDSLHQKAEWQLNSIIQLAIVDELNGIRWKDIADADDMDNSDEETLVILSEAFTLAGTSKDIDAGILKWVLTNKNEHAWNTTKAASAMINMLSKAKNGIAASTQSITGRLTDSLVSVNNDLFSGKYFSFIRIKEAEAIALQKQANGAATGSLSWYYFSNSDELSRLNSDVKVRKTFFRYDSKQMTWDNTHDNTIYKIGDKVRVTLTVETAKALKYVYIDDKRAASFEPADHKSGYDYEKGISYYKSVRDAGFQFFIDAIPGGRSSISYELVVAQEGSFTSGPAILQCMYNPGITSYSNYTTITSAAQ